MKIDTYGFPEVVRIEPSAICNFNCIHCENGQKHPDDRGIMDIALFNRVIDSFRENDYIPRVLVLYHGGESLTNPKLPEFIKISRDFGIKKIKIVTNASLLTREKSEQLINAGLTDLEVSFDGLSEVENNSIRKNGDFYRDSNNLIEFLKINQRKVNVSISNTIICKQKNQCTNIPSTPEYLRQRFLEWEDEVNIVSNYAMVWPGYDLENSMYNAVVFDKNKDIVKYCEYTFETVNILSNGNVVPCCYDISGNIVFGNVNVNSIFEIWSSKKMVEFRQSIINGNIPDFCKNCVINSNRYLIAK